MKKSRQITSVLLIEDDETDCILISRFIRKKKLPYRLEIAGESDRAMELLKTGEPDVILLDYDLGTINGLEMLPYCGNTPVIFITGNGNESVAVEAMKLGAYDYLVKDSNQIYIQKLPIAIDKAIKHRKTMDELRESEERLRITIRSLDDFLFVLDKDGTFVDYFQPSHAPEFAPELHAPPEFFLGKSFEEVMPPDVSALFSKSLEVVENNAIDTVQKFDYPLDISNVRKWYNAKVTARRNISGKLEGVTVVVRDITERKQAEEERLKVQNRLQQIRKFESLNLMAGSIAHSFNNLLMGVLGNLELALSNLPTGSDARHNILNADRAANRVADLSRLMLTYVGQAPGVSRLMDMSELINDMNGIFKASISKHIHLSFYISPEPMTLKGDPAQIREAVINLVANSAEAIGSESGTISIYTGKKFFHPGDFKFHSEDQVLPEGEYVYIRISDTGCGMDESTLSNAFDPFFTTRFKGRGMGLATVLGIARTYKGTVYLESEPGNGTDAVIIFPLAEIEQVAETPVTADDSIWQGSGTILLVDDEEMVRHVGKEMLEELGFDVMIACDGMDALEKFIQDPGAVSCVLLDMTMPKMGGAETFHRLREIKRNVPVILCSGFSEEQVANHFTDDLPAPFIGKPFQMNELAVKLKGIL